MSKEKIHFVSGLPRSGSTLLCNILAQNPEFHTTPTSACHEGLFTLRNAWGEWIEHKASDLGAEHNLQRVLNSYIYSYHDTDKPIIFDKGRGWLSLLELAEFATGEKAKVLVPVRNINSILASFEKLYRANAHKNKHTGDYFQAQTVEGRCKHLASSNEVLGLAYNRLKDCIQRGLSDRLFLVEFEDLTHNPEQSMRAIYDFLGYDYFEHNFANVEQSTYEDDSVHGMDLHTIHNEVKPVLDDSIKILGQDVHKQYYNSEFWRN